MSKIKEKIKKTAQEYDKLFRMADEMRKLANEIEDKAGSIGEENPSVFIEEWKNGNLAIYISTANIVPTSGGYGEVENIAPYEDYLVIPIDKYAYADLVAAIQTRFNDF